MSNDKEYLPFISNEALFNAIKKVVSAAMIAEMDADTNLHRNVIDPFSAVFDASIHNISMTQWLEQEKRRQIQKTFQNYIGGFHPEILGAIPDWEDMGRGHVIDLRNKKKKIIAEVKNKFNTTKGTDKKSIYDNIESQLNLTEYSGFTGYYVEIIPKGRKVYNKTFTPPDNTTHTNRSANARIRIIDGKSFYELASGDPNALKKLYDALPHVISDILNTKPEKIISDGLFNGLFYSAYR